MKLCQTCGQMLAEEITGCPSCGSEVAEGRKAIDDYRILEVLHEGYASILCRAVKEGAETPVMLRIFTPRAGINEMKPCGDTAIGHHRGKFAGSSGGSGCWPLW